MSLRFFFLLSLVLASPAFAQVGTSAAALEVDRLIAANFKKKDVKVPAVVDDTTFLRRTFLTTVGRIPTFDEVRFFLEIKDPKKRHKMIDHLMDSPGYVSHGMNWMADILRVKESDRNAGSDYVEYVREAFSKNKPWDQITKELISAEGIAHLNPAVGYYLRDVGMENDNLANTMRIFTGTHMECAQCHDHPFDEWEQMDFYQLAAFVHGQKRLQGPVEPLYTKIRRIDDGHAPLFQTLLTVHTSIYRQSVIGGGDGRVKLPHDYKYSDGEPGEWVGARTPFGKRVRISDKENSGKGRTELAKWLIDKKNDRFTQTIVNRLWKRVMGRGLYEPVDAYVEPEKTAHRHLIKKLNALLRDELKYDIKAFQKVLLYTRTYQFDSNPEQIPQDSPYYFNGRQLTRMTAEQIWDSIIALQVGNPDKLPTRQKSDTITRDGKAVLVGVKTKTEMINEALEANENGSIETYVEQLHELIEKHPQKSLGSGGGGSMMMGGGVSEGALKGLARASELRHPAPRGHLLREFGQSEREIIEGANYEGNVGQVLTILNGEIQGRLIANDDVSMFKMLQVMKSPRDKIRGLFLSILTRPPSDEELELMMTEVERKPERAYRNIAAALFSSHEFLFVK